MKTNRGKKERRERGDEDPPHASGPPPRRRALVIADGPFASTVHRLLLDEGLSVEWAPSAEQARHRIPRTDHQLAVIDLDLPGEESLELLRDLATRSDPARILVISDDPKRERVLHALEAGASEQARRPLHREELRFLLQRFLRGAPMRHLGLDLPGLLPLESKLMQELDGILERLARDSSLPVLVTGETGVGKESAVRSLHGRSERRHHPFIAFSCADLGTRTLRQELFGSEERREPRPGLVEEAGGGTLLLDEISQMPLPIQASLLRFLEDGRFRRVGGRQDLAADVRVVATTNRNVEVEVEEGRLLRDLYFRLSAAEVTVPPLRERPEDVRSLARFFCQQDARETGSPARLSEEALRTLEEHPWPGNVRELKHTIRRTVLLHGGGTIVPRDLRLASSPAPPAFTAPAGAPRFARPAPRSGEEEGEFPPLAEIERRHILAALERTSGNRSQAARILGISRSTLLRRLSRWEEA